MRKCFIFFIDGFGIGKKEEHNPFYCYKSNFLSHFIYEFTLGFKYFADFNGIVYKINTVSKVNGTPQSATGQTSLFTGIEASEFINMHLFGFPNKTLRKLLFQNNILKHCASKGLKVKFINAFGKFADLFNKNHIRIDADGSISFASENQLYLSLAEKIKRHISVSTVMALNINQSFYSINDIKNHQSLFHDITNEIESLNDKSILISPDEAAEVVQNNFKKYDILFFEYFLLDKYGHKKTVTSIKKSIATIDAFLLALLTKQTNFTYDILIVSDHGNSEDLHTGGHTLNPVPLIHLTNAQISIKVNTSFIQSNPSLPSFYNYALDTIFKS